MKFSKNLKSLEDKIRLMMKVHNRQQTAEVVELWVEKCYQYMDRDELWLSLDQALLQKGMPSISDVLEAPRNAVLRDTRPELKDKSVYTQTTDERLKADRSHVITWAWYRYHGEIAFWTTEENVLESAKRIGMNFNTPAELLSAMKSCYSYEELTNWINSKTPTIK